MAKIQFSHQQLSTLINPLFIKSDESQIAINDNIINMKLRSSALVGIGLANISTRCLAQTCAEIVAGGTNRKLEPEFLEEAGEARDGTDIHGIIGGTEVRHVTLVPLLALMLHVSMYQSSHTLHSLSSLDPLCRLRLAAILTWLD